MHARLIEYRMALDHAPAQYRFVVVVDAPWRVVDGDDGTTTGSL